MAHKSIQHGKTLFVGNLPYTATNEVLEAAFTEYGPTKSCFVVKGNGKSAQYVMIIGKAHIIAHSMW